MGPIDEGDHIKMDLLTGAIKTGELTDMLLDCRTMLSTEHMLEMILPLAELRAEQIEQGLGSTDETTQKEAERMYLRYSRKPLGDEDRTGHVNDAIDAVSLKREQEGIEDHSLLTYAVAENWLSRIVNNELIGEVEKELDRTIDSYQCEKEFGVQRLDHVKIDRDALREELGGQAAGVAR